MAFGKIRSLRIVRWCYKSYDEINQFTCAIILINFGSLVGNTNVLLRYYTGYWLF